MPVAGPGTLADGARGRGPQAGPDPRVDGGAHRPLTHVDRVGPAAHQMDRARTARSGRRRGPAAAAAPSGWRRRGAPGAAGRRRPPRRRSRRWSRRWRRPPCAGRHLRRRPGQSWTSRAGECVQLGGEPGQHAGVDLRPLDLRGDGPRGVAVIAGPDLEVPPCLDVGHQRPRDAHVAQDVAQLDAVLVEDDARAHEDGPGDRTAQQQPRDEQRLRVVAPGQRARTRPGRPRRGTNRQRQQQEERCR